MSRARQLDVRVAAMRAGFCLGALSILAVAAGLALDLPARRPAVIIALTVMAALAQAALSLVPWRRWLEAERGRALLGLWSAGVLAFPVALVLLAGASADLGLLYFLVMPFLATVHAGTPRRAWLATGLLCYAVTIAFAPDALDGGAIALRGVLLCGATLLALVLADVSRGAAAKQAEVETRAELERLLLGESHHRVKNSLQTVADLLLLGRPEGRHARAFDDTARRIRAIATVHEHLAGSRGGAVDVGALVREIANAIDPDANVSTEPVHLDAVIAQHVGIVANELITNAIQHGTPPIAVRLTGGEHITLSVHDAGTARASDDTGFGLPLVRQVVEHSLHGSFSFTADARETVARAHFRAAQ
jgi:two-component sensor histidine kinase